MNCLLSPPQNGVESADTMNSKLEGDLSRATNTIAKLEGLCKELEKMRKAARVSNMTGFSSLISVILYRFTLYKFEG